VTDDAGGSPRPRAYLAGPEVFLAEAARVGARKRAICARHGLTGVFPGDAAPPDARLARRDQGLAISRTMETLMRGCDLMIVNLTPLHGPSADVGSSYEMGFMRALGRPIFAYSNDPRFFAERVADFWDGAIRHRASGEQEGPDGMAIEGFDLHDNLMLVGGVIASGGCVVTEPTPEAERYISLAAFARCVACAAAHLRRAGSAARPCTS
jgi:nucleoside 2-deoxyribosyltransferase